MASDSNQQAEMVGPRGLVKKDELVRLIIQCLYSLGFNTSASQLEQESNISYKNAQFAVLESLVLQGKWQECIQVLEEIKDHIKSREIRATVLRIILKQCIFEYVSSGNIASALRFLQKDYSEFGVGKNKIHKLGMEILFNKETMRELSEMRGDLVSDLQIWLPPPLVLADRRLEKLVEMGINYQIISCLYHNTRDVFSLCRDHYCDKEHIPNKTLQVLTSHEDEVLFVQFSHNGELLASSSSDCTAIIWKVPEQGNLTVKHTLRGHQNPVSFLSWSPNDAMLVTCGEEILKLWNVERGVCRFFIRVDVPILSSCAWFPDSKRIVFGTCGPKKCINRFKIDEKKLTRWIRSTKNTITDLTITPDGNKFICVYSAGYSSYIVVWNHKKHTKLVFTEKLPITSVCVSGDSMWLLANLRSNEIHLLYLAGDLTYPMISLHHRKQLKFVIHSCFGFDSRLVASGSEDSQVYIWHRPYPQPIKILTGHSMVVNCVSWNPRRPEMLASASDDRTVRIWVGAGHINYNPLIDDLHVKPGNF